MKIRNVGAQTQKKWRPGGPPLEGREAEGWSPGEWGPEGSGGPRGVGPRPRKSQGPKGRDPKGRAPQHGGSKGGGPKAGPAFKNTTKIQREDPQRERTRAKMGAGEEKSAKFWEVRRRGVQWRGVWRRGSGGGIEKKTKNSKQWKISKQCAEIQKISKKGKKHTLL